MEARVDKHAHDDRMDRRQVGLRATEGWTSQRLLRMKRKYRELENLK